jgi:hypothetical protein
METSANAGEVSPGYSALRAGRVPVKAIHWMLMRTACWHPAV